MQHHTRRTHVLEGFLLAALVLDQLQDPPNVLFVGQNRRQNHGLVHLGNLARVGPARGIVNLNQLAVSLGNFVADAGRGGDEFQRELALQTLLNDFHVQQPEETTAETESKSDGTLRLEKERRIIQPQFFQRLAQAGMLVRVHRVESGEYHRLDLFKAR